jgi:hypothetical protein
MPNGTRSDGYTDTPTDLYFQFLKRINYNLENYSAHEVKKVEIFSTMEDAEAGTSVIQTIQPANITEVSTGKYYYVADALSSVGTYFDKILLTPDEGWSDRSFINPFYIRLQDYTGSTPGSHERCRVYLNLFDIVDNPQEGDRVVVRMNVQQAWYGKDFIESEEEVFYANAAGQILGQDDEIGMLLLETDTLTSDTFPNTDTEVYYIVNVLDKYFYKKTIPRGTLQSNFKDLPDVE